MRKKVSMGIGNGEFTYEWFDNWARIPDTRIGRENGRTHGIVVTGLGTIIVFHQANPAVLVFNTEGKLLSTWGDRFLGAHGMTLVREGDLEFLWFTDEHSAEVVKTTLDGKKVMTLRRPDHPVYRTGKYSPTWVAVNQKRYGGNGDIWVADGYGMHYVHRYDKAGYYLHSINGTEGQAGPFDCPHGIWVDTRKSEPELYIADRGNKRFQVYDMEGKFKRSFGSDILTCPCGCITYGNVLIVPELSAKLAILDIDDKLICYLGENERVCTIPGWPNHPPELLEPEKFNSPHAVAVDGTGNLYVVEWIIGGRITKLTRCS